MRCSARDTRPTCLISRLREAQNVSPIQRGETDVLYLRPGADRRHRFVSRPAWLARRGAEDGRAPARQRRPLGCRDGRDHADAHREEQQHGARDPVRRGARLCQRLPHALRPLLVDPPRCADARAAAEIRAQGRHRAALSPAHAGHEAAAAALRERRANPPERARRRRGRRAQGSFRCRAITRRTRHASSPAPPTA